MPPALLCAAIVFLLVKGVSALWLIRQPDATTVLDSRHGRVIYYASKVSVILFLAAMLTRSLVQSEPRISPAIWAAGLAVAIVMVVKVNRQRHAGESFGFAHDLKVRQPPLSSRVRRYWHG